ncbi:MAG TPA: Hpt domain-containing protein [Rhodopseudomonas sp.]|uniref:Hpt domain-containing protein n=1 Tax=Rhodopseudomonas sp. TaxID=1078 RepID=UPI002EDB97EE
MLSEPLIDHTQIALLRRALGDEDLRDMLAELPEVARQGLDKIRAAVAASDLDEARRNGHALKGVASSFGAARIAAEARKIEAAGSSIAAISQGVALLERLIDETAVALAELCPASAEATSP